MLSLSASISNEISSLINLTNWLIDQASMKGEVKQVGRLQRILAMLYAKNINISEIKKLLNGIRHELRV